MSLLYRLIVLWQSHHLSSVTSTTSYDKLLYPCCRSRLVSLLCV